MAPWTPDHRRRVEALYDEMLARPAEERAAALVAACPDDPGLRAEVASLLDPPGAPGMLDSHTSDVAADPRSPASVPLIGHDIGAYSVTGLLGVGGMGEVYRAQDTRLRREVALKILPRAFRDDPARIARFEQEARSLASLNHPQIAAIYGLEDSGAGKVLVMELVEGDDLSDRIAQGDMPLDQTLAIARQVAEALEAAHEQGIIHRDLKPANIKVRRDGTVKVLDFGLAKALAPVTAAVTLTALPTRAGVILGTPAYMSPEQARGDPADRQADIWSFGVVLYELLTGVSPFSGRTTADTLASVLGTQPDFSRLPADTPSGVRHLIRRCLEKDRKRRLQHMGDVRIELDDALAALTSGTLTEQPMPVRGRERRGPGPLGTAARAAVLAVVVAGLTASVMVWGRADPQPAQGPGPLSWGKISPALRETLPVNNALDPDLAISRDGARHVFVTGFPGEQQLNVGSGGQEAQRLEGVGSSPRAPFFSPDGNEIGFFESNFLRSVSVHGGPVRTIAAIDGDPRGASWGADGTIVFATDNPATGLFRVSTRDGEPPVVVTTPEAGEGDHLWPEVLPGHNAVAFTIAPLAGTIEKAQLAVFDASTGDRRQLGHEGTSPRYAASGHLVYALDDDALWATRFDLATLTTQGDPVKVRERVVTKVSGAASFGIADDGTLVYLERGMPGVPGTPVWIDRQHRVEPLGAPPRRYAEARISPDASRVAFGIRDHDDDIWIWEQARPGTLRRLTDDPGLDRAPVWSPDGEVIVYGSNRGGAENVYWQAADGTGPAGRLTRSPNLQVPESFTSDDMLLFIEVNSPGQNDIRMLPWARGRAPGSPVSLLDSVFFERHAAVSPDNRWLGYASNESGEGFEVYLRTWPPPDDLSRWRDWRVSSAGGLYPKWACRDDAACRRGDFELLFIDRQGRILTVPVRSGPSGPDTGTTQVAFDAQLSFGAIRPFDITRDGERLLTIKEDGPIGERSTPPEIWKASNWLGELERLVPAP